jgi:hypothetical protein
MLCDLCLIYAARCDLSNILSRPSWRPPARASEALAVLPSCFRNGIATSTLWDASARVSSQLVAVVEARAQASGGAYLFGQLSAACAEAAPLLLDACIEDLAASGAGAASFARTKQLVLAEPCDSDIVAHWADVVPLPGKLRRLFNDKPVGHDGVLSALQSAFETRRLYAWTFMQVVAYVAPPGAAPALGAAASEVLNALAYDTRPFWCSSTADARNTSGRAVLQGGSRVPERQYP